MSARRQIHLGAVPYGTGGTGTPHAVARPRSSLAQSGGLRDVLNDATHRSVAATMVLPLESLRLGPDLPTTVKEIP